MGQLSTSEIRGGAKIEVDGVPYNVISNEFVKPGKGRSFNRIRMKNLLSDKVVEKTFTSGDKIDEADIVDTNMRYLYKEGEGGVFMDDVTFEQVTIDGEHLKDVTKWLKEDLVYDIIFYKGAPIAVEPPTFMELLITDTLARRIWSLSPKSRLKPA